VTQALFGGIVPKPYPVYRESLLIDMKTGYTINTRNSHSNKSIPHKSANAQKIAEALKELGF
jgi:hypothetical protein